METINDKELEKLLDMQEHPENYSDEQLEAMLDSEDFRLLSEAKRAMAQRNVEVGDVEKELERFSKERRVKNEEFDSEKVEEQKNSSLFTLHSSLTKHAAMFVGVVMLAGFAFAAIRMVKEREPMPIAEDTTEITLNKAESNSVEEEKTDTIANEKIVQFDDAELGDILSAMAAHYNLKLVYENEAAKGIKLFLKWDKQAGIDKALEILNSYDRINIEHRGDELIVK